MKRVRLFTLLLTGLFKALAADTIAINNPAIVSGLSPYNWYQVGSTSITAVNPGAYVKFNFTGTSLTVALDLSNLVDQGVASVLWPVIAYTVDGVRTVRQIISTDTTVTLATGLADATHSLRLDLIGVDEGGTIDRWTLPRMALVLTSFAVDSGKTVTRGALLNGGYMLAYGDSITEGAVALGAYLDPPSYAQIEDATKGYQAVIAQYLNMEYGNVAFAGQSWSGGVQNVPGLPSSYNLYSAGRTRLFVPVPNIVTINMATNGTPVAATVTTFLGTLRAAVGAACRIVFIIPFGQQNAATLTTAYDDYVAANPGDAKIQKIDLGSGGSSIVSAHSYDALHPDAAGQQLLGQAVAPLVVSPLSAGNPTFAAAPF